MKNIVFVLLSVCFLFVTAVSAQTDSVLKNYFTFFQENVKQLASTYFLLDENHISGKFKSEAVYSFSVKYNSLQQSVFPETMANSSFYFQFFNSLSEVEQKNLIRLFSYYEKDFELVLKNEQLPVELKYLAPALSVLNEKAITENRAGVWQLTHFQAVLHGCEINRFVDERFNILLSTQMAARELKQNLETFKSTELAVIAYLCGNTKLENTLAEIGENAGTNEILEYLPAYVSEVLQAFQAMCVFLTVNTYHPDTELPGIKYFPDTVLVYRQMHFQQIEKVLGVKTELVQFLNPHFKYSIVPESGAGRKLALPTGIYDDFVLLNDSINQAADSSHFLVFSPKIEYPPEPNRQYLGEPVKDLVIEGKTKIQYHIKTGDVLGIIAEKYDVNISELKYWNNIVNERRIQAGQKLDIFVTEEEAEYYIGLEKQESEIAQKTQDLTANFQNSTRLNIYELFDTSKKTEHIVKSGESPFVIAKQYEGVTPELILQWNNIDDPRKIQIGQKLIIYPKL